MKKNDLSSQKQILRLWMNFCNCVDLANEAHLGVRCSETNQAIVKSRHKLNLVGRI